MGVLGLREERDREVRRSQNDQLLREGERRSRRGFGDGLIDLQEFKGAGRKEVILSCSDDRR